MSSRMDGVAVATGQLDRLAPAIRDMTSAELRSASESIARRRRAGEESPDVLAQGLALCREAIRRAHGMWPAGSVMDSAAVVAHGAIAQMRGGTVTADGMAAIAVAAFWQGLTGPGTHVITVDDGRARLIEQFLTPVLALLGADIGLLTDDVTGQARRAAYQRTVTVGSYSQFATDYLRDNLQDSPAETIRGDARSAIVDDVAAILVGHALAQVVMTAPRHEPERDDPVADRAAAQLRRDVDYRVFAAQGAVAFTPEAMARIKDDVGWAGEPSLSAVTSACRAERAVLRREGVTGDDERQILADITVQGYVRTYETVGGVSSGGPPVAALLDRVYGLASQGPAERKWTLIPGRDKKVEFDEAGLEFERVVDHQRAQAYRARAEARAGTDVHRLAESLAAEAVRCWADRGVDAVNGGVADVLAGYSPAGQTAESPGGQTAESPGGQTAESPGSGGVNERAEGLVRQALVARIGELGEPAALGLMRDVRLTVIDLQWRDHLARVRFLQRHGNAIYAAGAASAGERREDLRSLFDSFLRQACDDSIKYFLHVRR